MPTKVNVDNFVRAETDRMFADLQRDSGAVNTFRHEREPASVDHQTVIRMNRDTLYSFAVVDLAGGATLTIPEHGNRYLSAMVVSNDHHINLVFHEGGEHSFDAQSAGSEYALIAVRILVDPNDRADLQQVMDLQDQLTIEAGSARTFVSPEYDQTSMDETRKALLQLAAGMGGVSRAFGSADQVDPVRHLIGAAAGWGGLPGQEATYMIGIGDPTLGNCELKMDGVPVDAFWSISVYNEDGFFEPNEAGVYSANSVTSQANEDGSVTVRFGDFPDNTPNAIPTPEGWNYLIRLYRPRPEILNGSWQPPVLVPAL